MTTQDDERRDRTDRIESRIYRAFRVTTIPNINGSPRTVVFAWTSVDEMLVRGVAKRWP